MQVELPKLESELQEKIDLGDEVVRTVSAAAERLRHNQSDPQMFALALYGSIIELFSACLVLAKFGEPTGIPVLLRPMYEALVDLDNLVQDHAYVDYMKAANYKQTIQLMSSSVLRSTLTEGNPGVLDELTAAQSALAAKGVRKLGIRDRCKRVHRTDQYDTLYGLFCVDSHNNGAALAERHMSETPDGRVIISIFGEYDPAPVTIRLIFGIQFLLEAAQMIHGAFRVPASPVDALVTRIDQERRIADPRAPPVD